jgi:pimeloyl-ACP methyl ester carboxylesterase
MGGLAREARLCRLYGRLSKLWRFNTRAGDGRGSQQNQPVTRSYLALRDIEAMVNHIKRTRNVQKVTLIGWSWGAMMGGYYASTKAILSWKAAKLSRIFRFHTLPTVR